MTYGEKLVALSRRESYASNIQGTLGDLAMQQLLRLVNAGNVEAIKLVLSAERLIGMRLGEIELAEVRYLQSMLIRKGNKKEAKK